MWKRRDILAGLLYGRGLCNFGVRPIELDVSGIRLKWQVILFACRKNVILPDVIVVFVANFFLKCKYEILL